MNVVDATDTLDPAGESNGIVQVPETAPSQVCIDSLTSPCTAASGPTLSLTTWTLNVLCTPDPVADTRNGS